MKRYFTLFLLLVISTFCKSQTCIIAAVRGNGKEILVATDSRRAGYIDSIGNDGVKYNVYRAYTACKVGNYKNTFYSQTGFDVVSAYSLAEECAKEGGSIKDIAERYANLREYHLKKFVINEIIKGATDSIIKAIYNHFGTYFYKFESGIPTMAFIDLRLTRQGDFINIKHTIEYFEGKDGKTQFYIAGEHEVADSVFKEALKATSVEESVKIAIIEQSKATPLHVGLPIILFKIGVDGLTWIENPLGCLISNTP